MTRYLREKRALLALAVLLGASSFGAGATEWIYVGQSTTLDALYIDVSSILREGDLVTAWQAGVHTEPYIDSRGLQSWSGFVLMSYNCQERSQWVRELKFFAGSNFDGGVVVQDTSVNGRKIDVPPDSLSLKIFEIVCEDPSGGRLSRPNGLPIYSTGTGFFVDGNGTLITSNHVVDGATEISVQCTERVVSEAVVVATSRKTDVAVLRVTNLNAQYLTLASPQSTTTGTPVFTLGFPVYGVLGDEAKFTDGAISSMTGIGGEQAFMQISIPIQPGNSGGPVVNDRGEVVGIVAGSAAIEPFLKSTGTLPQNINWAVKSEYAAVLIDGPPSLPPTRSRQEAISRTKDAICLVFAK